MATPVWNEWCDIRSYDADFRGDVSMQTLCRFFQEAAGNHARDLGVSIDTLFTQGMTWVLSRFHIAIHRRPRWRERVRIETWPSNALGFYVLRDFNLYDEQDQRLVSASSIWLILDLEKRIPLRIPEHILAMRVPDRERALNDSFDTLWRPDQVTAEKRFTVRCSDLDLNQHVNNVSYVEWAVESVPDEVWQTHQITELEVSFRAETMYGETVLSQCEQIADEPQSVFTHRVLRESDRTEMFLARTRWQKKAEELS